MKIGLPALGLTLALACCDSAAHAQQGGPQLDVVRQQMDLVEYEQAAARLAEVVEQGQLHTNELVEAHRLGGEILAALGHVSAARRHFVRWLTLSPKAKLPSGTSPKIREVYEHARRRVQARGRLKARPRMQRSVDGTWVELIVDHDPEHMVRGMRITYRLGSDASGRAREITPRGLGTTLPVPAGEEVFVRVAALDAHGNELLARWANAPGYIPPAVVEDRTERVRHRLYVAWYPVAAVAVAAAGLGAYFGIQSRRNARDLTAINHNNSHARAAEGRALQARGERNALLANVGFGAAGLSAVAAALLLWRGSRHPSTTQVAPAVGIDGSASLVVRRTF